MYLDTKKSYLKQHVRRKPNVQCSDELRDDEFVESKLLSSCSSCKDEGQTVAAIRYCVDCEEYQCHKCFKFHDRYNKGHEVYDASSRQKWGTKKQVKLPTEKCPTHIGEVIQLYCEDHDALCCHVCFAMKHSTCEGKQYIPELAKGFTKENKEFGILNDKLDKIRTDIQNVIDESKQNKESIRISREKFEKQLQETRQKFEALYYQLEQISYTELGQSHDTMDAEVDGTIKSCNVLLSEVKRLSERVSPDTSTNESQLFINMKQVTGQLTGMMQKVEKVSKPQWTGIECQTGHRVNTFLSITGCLSTSMQAETKPEHTDGILTSNRTTSQGTPTKKPQEDLIRDSPLRYSFSSCKMEGNPQMTSCTGEQAELVKTYRVELLQEENIVEGKPNVELCSTIESCNFDMEPRLSVICIDESCNDDMESFTVDFSDYEVN